MKGKRKEETLFDRVACKKPREDVKETAGYKRIEKEILLRKVQGKAIVHPSSYRVREELISQGFTIDEIKEHELCFSCRSVSCTDMWSSDDDWENDCQCDTKKGTPVTKWKIRWPVQRFI